MNFISTITLILTPNTTIMRHRYRPYNQYDELESVNCVAFSRSGHSLYAGSRNLIRVFDVRNPGRMCTEIPTCTSKKDVFGYKGIISALAFNPQGKLYAAGSYSNHTALYAGGAVLDHYGAASLYHCYTIRWPNFMDSSDVVLLYPWVSPSDVQ